MPAVTFAQWQENRHETSLTPHRDNELTGVLLTATVEGLPCHAVHRRGRLVGLQVGSRFSPLAVLESYRAAVVTFPHFPIDRIDAIDEVLSLSGSNETLK